MQQLAPFHDRIACGAKNTSTRKRTYQISSDYPYPPINAKIFHDGLSTYFRITACKMRVGTSTFLGATVALVCLDRVAAQCISVAQPTWRPCGSSGWSCEEAYLTFYLQREANVSGGSMQRRRHKTCTGILMCGIYSLAATR